MKRKACDIQENGASVFVQKQACAKMKSSVVEKARCVITASASSVKMLHNDNEKGEKQQEAMNGGIGNICSNEKGEIAACQLYRILRLRHRASPIFLTRNLSYKKGFRSTNAVNKRENSAGIEFICQKLASESQKQSSPMNYIQVVLRFTYHGITFNEGFAESGLQNGLDADSKRMTTNAHYSGGKLNLLIYNKSIATDLQNVGSLKISLNGSTPVKNGAAKCLAIPIKLPAIESTNSFFLRATLVLHSITRNGKNGTSPNGIKNYITSKSFSWDLALKDVLNKTNIEKGATTETEFEMLLNSSTAVCDPLNGLCLPGSQSNGSSSENENTSCAIHSYISSAIGALKFHVGVDVVPSCNSGNSSNFYSPASPGRSKKLAKNGQHLKLVSPQAGKQPQLFSLTYEQSNAVDDQKLFIIFRFPHKTNHKFVSSRSGSCPWCGVRESSINLLLIHFHLCHPMYNYRVARKDDDFFTWVINVSLSKLSVNAELASFTFRSYHKTTKPPNLLFDVNNLTVEQLNQYLKPSQVKNRKTCFRSKTGLLMPEYQQNIDSDEEPCSLEWQNEYLGGLLDEFVDVSEEEKRVMKLWNNHRMAFNHVTGDSQVQLILRSFLRDVIGRMSAQQLDLPFTGCLILHIYNLYSFGCLDLKSARDSLLIVQCIRADPIKFLPLLSTQR